MKIDKENIKKPLLLITFGVVLFWALQNLNMIGGIFNFIFKLILPFIIGLGLAFIINIPLNFIEKRIWKSKKNKKQKAGGFKRTICVILSFALIVGIIFFVLFLVIPELVQTLTLFKDNIPHVFEDVQEWMEQMVGRYPEISQNISNAKIDWNSINENINQFLTSSISGIINSSFTIIANTITTIVNMVVGTIFAFYILMQKEKLLEQIKKVLKAYLKPEREQKIVHIATITNNTFNRFFSGQFTESIILGILCFIGMLILNIPYALTVSVLVGFTSLIPVFGAFIGVIVGTILIVVTQPMKAIIFVIFFLVLQQIEGNIIYPKVVGDSVGLPAIWVMVAVTIGGGVLGLLGILISVPISSILYCILKESVNKKLEKDPMDQIEDVKE